MQNMQHWNGNIFKVLNAILAIALSLIGYESCKEDGSGDAAEYGSPSAEYIFRGKVTDQKGNALPNVKVSYVGEKGHCLTDSRDSLTSTDAEGNYFARYRTFMWVDGEGLRFSADDGVYKDTLMNSSDLAPLKDGDGNWFDGRSENTLDITINK